MCLHIKFSFKKEGFLSYLSPRLELFNEKLFLSNIQAQKICKFKLINLKLVKFNVIVISYKNSFNCKIFHPEIHNQKINLLSKSFHQTFYNKKYWLFLSGTAFFIWHSQLLFLTFNFMMKKVKLMEKVFEWPFRELFWWIL